MRIVSKSSTAAYVQRRLQNFQSEVNLDGQVGTISLGASRLVRSAGRAHAALTSHPYRLHCMWLSAVSLPPTTLLDRADGCRQG